MRLNTGRTPSAWRRAVTLASVVSASTASRASEKPMALRVRMPNAFAGRPLFLILLSISTMPRISPQNPGVDFAGGEDLVIAPAEPHRLRDLQQTIRRRRAERGADRVLV